MTTDIRPDQTKELHKLISKVARNVSREWPDSVEADDIEQDLWVTLLESSATIKGILDADPREAEQMIYRLATREAAKAREAYDYFSGNFNYSVNEVRALLDQGVLIKALEGFDAAKADVFEALEVMSWEKSPYTNILIERFAEFDTTPLNATQRKDLTRAVDELSRRMNRIARKREQHGLKARPRGEKVAI